MIASAFGLLKKKMMRKNGIMTSIITGLETEPMSSGARRARRWRHRARDQDKAEREQDPEPDERGPEFAKENVSPGREHADGGKRKGSDHRAQRENTVAEDLACEERAGRDGGEQNLDDASLLLLNNALRDGHAERHRRHVKHHAESHSNEVPEHEARLARVEQLDRR